MRLFSAFLLIVTFICFTPERVVAIENPLETSNNKFGIHILFASEIEDAARLVNSNGGEWGYVVVPIQATDKNLDKWQEFMNKAAELRVIPIIRLATENYYFDKKVWRKPNEKDILDFANFLDSLEWPVKNRYVILFNEVNRDDEWEGDANPEEYARLLQYAVLVFKSRNPDFFIISAGLDNASVDDNNAVNKLTYLRRMEQAVPGIFKQIDGFASHAYPNPDFSSPPHVVSTSSIASFRYEKALIARYRSSALPMFITETGWSNRRLSEEQRASYYKYAFSAVWNDPDIVAVTPFLLYAGSGPFHEFSFLKEDGKPTKQYAIYASFPKIKGKPSLKGVVKNETTQHSPDIPNLPKIAFTDRSNEPKRFSKTQVAMGMFTWLFNL
jgi:hypothetical protein